MRSVSVHPSIQLLVVAFFFFGAAAAAWTAIDAVIDGQIAYSARRGGPTFTATQDREPLVYWTFISILVSSSICFTVIGCSLLVEAIRRIRRSSPKSR